MSDPTFKPWPKTPRWNSRLIITEKLDGTNACVSIRAHADPSTLSMALGGLTAPDPDVLATVSVEIVATGSVPHDVRAGSRSRWLRPEKSQDNFGFARWVQDNADALAKTLGPGDHWGEWFGAGIQRTYGLAGKHFAIFNTSRFIDMPRVGEPGWEQALVCCVPVLHEGEDASGIGVTFHALRGKSAVNGFDKPEGICIYQVNSRTVYKMTFEAEGGKWRETQTITPSDVGRLEDLL